MHRREIDKGLTENSGGEKVSKMRMIVAIFAVETDETIIIYFSPGEGEYKIELVHYRQKYTWDCGLSCIMMVLPEKNRRCFINNFNDICENEGFGRSTWTIDLCYLMKRFSLKFIFYTTVIGINPEHESHCFYEKILPKDKERVLQRFKDAEKNGIEIREKSIKTREMINHIRNHGPVILLINAGYINCDCCKRSNLTDKLINYFPQSSNYHGHYIILCGYNLNKRQFYYRNPANSNRVCAMEFSELNKARFCFGTDEDCIFVFQ